MIMEKTSNKTVARNIMWNTIGSLFYLVCQWLISIFVVHFSPNGYDSAGVLSLAMSISTFFSVITMFNVRNYQVADSVGKFSSSQYIFHRILTCAVSFVLCCVFVLANGYDITTSLSIIAYMIVRLIEGFADVLHGAAQKKWRLDIAGKSFIIRGALLIVSFSVSMLLWKNLALSIFIMAGAMLVSLIFYDFIAVKRVDGFSLTPDFKASLSLSKICLPMVLYSACVNSVVPFARYLIEAEHGETVLGYYAAASTVAVLVQAFANLIFTPFIGIFEQAYEKDDRRSLAKLFIKLIALLVGVTLLAFGATALLGDFAMSLVFGEEIRPYVYLLYPTIVSSCLTAFVWLMGMLLVVMRDSKTMLIGALCCFALNITLCLLTIKETVYLGANVSIISSLSLASIIYLIRFIVYLTSKKRINNDNTQTRKDEQ